MWKYGSLVDCNVLTLVSVSDRVESLNLLQSDHLYREICFSFRITFLGPNLGRSQEKSVILWWKYQYFTTVQHGSEKGVEKYKYCQDGRLKEMCRGEWRWMNRRKKQSRRWAAVRRKEEKCNRNERALLLLIIGVVMCQLSLRGFPPEGAIPQRHSHWNHIIVLLCALPQ